MNTNRRNCIFRLGAHTLALPGEHTRQVHTVTNLRAVPRANPLLRGLFPVRSSVLPLVTLEPLLGLEVTAHTLAVQMEFDGRELAFGVSEVVGFYPVQTTSSPVPAQFGRLRDLGSEMLNHLEEPVIVLNAERLMDALSQAFGATRLSA